MRDRLISVWTLFFVCHSSELTLTSSNLTPDPRTARSGQFMHGVFFDEIPLILHVALPDPSCCLRIADF
jgi:hypothetical protein